VFGKRIWQGLASFNKVTPINSDLENTVDARNEGPVVTVDVESKIGHDVQSDSDVLVSLKSYSIDDDMESAFSSLHYFDSSKPDRVDASKYTTSSDAKSFDSADGAASVNDSGSADGSASVNDSDCADGAASVNDSDSVDGAASVNDSDCAGGSASVNDSDCADGAASVNESDSVDGAASVNNSDSANGSTSVIDSDCADGFDSGDSAVSVNDTDIADNIGSSLTVYGADHVDTVSDSSQDEVAETS
jgi:hypothetical protein